MKRRTLDILFSAGGVLFAVLFLVLGLVLQNQADFANSYVAHQLGDQKIVFTPAAALGGADLQPGGDCLVTYADAADDDRQAGRVLRQPVHRLPPERGGQGGRLRGCHLRDPRQRGARRSAGGGQGRPGPDRHGHGSGPADR